MSAAAVERAAQNDHMGEMVRDGVTRAVGAIGLAGIALIHTIDAPSHFVGGPDTWLGVMFIGVIASSLVLAAGLVVRGDRRFWAAAAGLSISVIVGFTLSRTVGLPGDSGDIGNWSEPLGISSLFVEGSLLMLSIATYAAKHTIARVRSLPGDLRPVETHSAGNLAAA